MNYRKIDHIVLVFGLGLILCLIILFFLPYQEVDRFHLTKLSAADGSIDGYNKDYILLGHESVFFTITNLTSILLLILLITAENKKTTSVIGIVLTAVIIFLKICWLLVSLFSQVFIIKTTPLLGFGLGFLLALILLTFWIVCFVLFKNKSQRTLKNNDLKSIAQLDEELGL